MVTNLTTVGRIKVQMIRWMLISVDVAGMIAIRLIIHVHKWAIVDQFERATRSILEKTRTSSIKSLAMVEGWRRCQSFSRSRRLSFFHSLKSEMGVCVCTSSIILTQFCHANPDSTSSTRKRRKKEENKAGREGDERDGTITHPHRVQCARTHTHTHTHARVARITFGFISRMLIFQNKRRRTDGSRRRQFCSVARARSDPAWHTHARTTISIGWVERE